MSHLSIALQRCTERRQLNQSGLAKLSGLSGSFISRLFNGESADLSDDNFTALLKVFAPDPQAQAEIIAARCTDPLAVARAAHIQGAEMVEIHVKGRAATKDAKQTEFPDVELSHETERAFAFLRSECPLNPDLERHLVGYARLMGMR